MPVRVTVQLDGHREIQRKLRSEWLLTFTWSAAMQRVAKMAEASWLGAAPVASGLERSKIVSKVQARPIPKYALVKTTATRSSRKYKRYRYPNRQEYDPKSRNRLKLTDALQGVMGRIGSVLDMAARAIEGRWRS